MSKDGRETYERGEAVLSIFKRGAEFTKRMLDENERLRAELNQVQTRQTSAAQDPEDWEKLRQELLNRIEDLEAERQNILEHLRSVEDENKQFAERYLEIEEENNNLANLYVASYQLHSTLDPSEVLKVILEIVINLVGAEVFCVYVCDRDAAVLEPVASEGAELSAFDHHVLGTGFVGEAVEQGAVAYRDSQEAISEQAGEAGIVCIPLRIADQPVGAIVIERLLKQKHELSQLDQELFTLLAGHAATAIFASRLYAQSERKLNTIQGFIDLLTK
jgi:nitrate/nitrite-specific signal transduction histidine kinase